MRFLATAALGALAAPASADFIILDAERAVTVDLAARDARGGLHDPDPVAFAASGVGAFDRTASASAHSPYASAFVAGTAELESFVGAARIAAGARVILDASTVFDGDAYDAVVRASVSIRFRVTRDTLVHYFLSWDPSYEQIDFIRLADGAPLFDGASLAGEVGPHEALLAAGDYLITAETGLYAFGDTLIVSDARSTFGAFDLRAVAAPLPAMLPLPAVACLAARRRR